MYSTDEMLVTTCRTMIKTVLSCLDNATKGTITKIGPMPELIAGSGTSGSRKHDSDEFEWGLPAGSGSRHTRQKVGAIPRPAGPSPGGNGLVHRKAVGLDGGRSHA